MALQDLLQLSNIKAFKKQEISEQRVRDIMPALRDAIAFWREYPDYFVDFLCGDNPRNFHLYCSQRMFLRAAMRHRMIYATYPRGYSKSFLSTLILMLRCILYPNSHLFVTTATKEQAAGIAKEKVEELCKLIPGLRNEIDWSRGASKVSKDDFCIIFKNGSRLDIMIAKNSSRGKRATGGLVEEVILVDGEALNEIIIPTMAHNRKLGDGTVRDDETVNKSQVYITTAGYRNSFAYQKLIEVLVTQVLYPDKAVVLGGTWKLPVTEGIQDKSWIRDIQMSDTYTDASFTREYGSEWSGDSENAFFSADKFDQQRTLLQAEYEHSGRSAKNAYYVLGVDVGRKGCNTEIVVFKVTPQIQGSASKSVVNLYSLDNMHFEEQAVHIKKLFYKYKAQMIAIDANGLGVGLIDFMVKSQTDPESGEILPDFGVFNDDEGFYKKFKTPDTEQNALFLIKANAPINTEIYSYIQAQMIGGKIKFLIDELQAKNKMMSTKVGQAKSPTERAEYLIPYQLTTMLRDQILNLTEQNEGLNIILKQSSRGIPKDKFSAFAYGLYYIKKEEEKNRKKRGHSLVDFVFYSNK